MIRGITLGAATALLIVGLPVAALGFSQSFDVDPTPTVTAEQVQMEIQEPVELSEQMELAVQELIGTPPVDAALAQAQTQQRIQEHIATGVPEDVVPVQNRMRSQKQAQVQVGGGESPGEPAASGEGNRFGQTEDATRGNAGAEPSADCPNDGECPNDGDCPNS